MNRIVVTRQAEPQTKSGAEEAGNPVNNTIGFRTELIEEGVPLHTISEHSSRGKTMHPNN